MKAVKRILAWVLTLMLLASTCAFSAMAEESAADPSSKLLAEYTFNNENVKDSVGINHAVFYDNQSVSDPTFTEGVVGRGLQLSTKGMGQRFWLDIPYDVFEGNENTFSISLWYKASGYNRLGEDSQLFSFYNSKMGIFMFHSYAAVAFQDFAYSMRWSDETEAYGYANLWNVPYQENEWVHLVYTVENVDGMSVIKAYVNGQTVKIEQGGNWENSLMTDMGIDSFTIGGKNPYKGGSVPMCLFYGVVDEVQIYSGALNADEAAYLYNYQLNAPDPEPVPDPDPTEPQPTEPQPTDPQPTDPQPTDPQPTDPQPTDPQPTESQPYSNTSGDQGGNDWLVPVIIGVVVVAAAAVAVIVLKKKK